MFGLCLAEFTVQVSADWSEVRLWAGVYVSIANSFVQKAVDVDQENSKTKACFQSAIKAAQSCFE